MYFLALHHSILRVFEYLIKNAFILDAPRRFNEQNTAQGCRLKTAALTRKVIALFGI